MESGEESDCDRVFMEQQLPAKSKSKYLHAYDKFMEWKTKNKEDSLSESVFLAYFTQLSKVKKPSSLWAIYSMLKLTVRVKDNVYIQNYANLLWFLRKKAAGFKSIRSKILTEDDITKFINEAPDEIYLVIKVALIFGICGGCRSIELSALTTKNVKNQGDVIVVDVRDHLNKTSRMFVVRDEFVSVVHKYRALRPKGVETDRFFLNYREGKCVKQVIGRNKIATMPKKIATFLKLPNPESYTGHCFRRSSAISGANWTTLRQGRRYAKEAEIMREAQMKESETSRPINIPDTEHDYATVRDLSYDISIKTEEIQQTTKFDPLLLSKDRKRSNMESLREFEACSPELDLLSETQPQPELIVENIVEESVQIKTEEMDETIKLPSANNSGAQSQPRTSSQKLHVSSDEQQTNISVAGKNITIIFKNCASVGNISINILNK